MSFLSKLSIQPYELNYVFSSYVWLVVEQIYDSEVNNEYVIRGNSVVMKCSIPSFVSDFVTVVSWEDEKGYVLSSDSSYGKEIKQSEDV